MVCNGSWRPRDKGGPAHDLLCQGFVLTLSIYTDLGLGFRRTEALSYGSHFSCPRARSLIQASVFVQLWRGQGECIISRLGPSHNDFELLTPGQMVKCWDLEANKVIRHYHGHLSGVYSLSLHPTLDVLVTAGRDATARVSFISWVRCATHHLIITLAITGLGYADKIKYLHIGGTHCHCGRREMSGL